jgi:hypothetical protein
VAAAAGEAKEGTEGEEGTDGEEGTEGGEERVVAVHTLTELISPI